ncbi:MAG: LuxR C-terminal-related transcriptional regulator [Jatrophihabitans sp.]|uniref:LuxR C-terminal-related transcriptional regulator n=1 Tax=Jatrophihabitans sp. TaxID=1932789 RepID=UPI003F7DAE66
MVTVQAQGRAARTSTQEADTLSTMHAVSSATAPVEAERAATKVLVVEAHPIVRWALARMADREHDLASVGTAESIDEALPLIAELRPVVITLAIETGQDQTELDRVPELRTRFPELGVVVLASEPDDELLFRALDVGASAFVIKRAPVEEILSAVRHAAVASGSFSATGLADALRRRSVAASRPALAARDREVLDMLHRGMSTAEVARTLYVSHSTAKARIAHLYDKLGAANRAQALMAAVRLGLIEP